MNRFFLLLVLILISGKAVVFAQPWSGSPNPMAQYYKAEGWPAWSDAIRWNNRINMAAYTNGANDFQKFENARDELALQGGGVLYYPAGTYNFADHPTGPNTGRGLMLKKGVVILGEKPSADSVAVVDSVTQGLRSLGTKFIFPFRDHLDSLGNPVGQRPDVWNMIGLYADGNQRISDQSFVGIAWVNLVGGYIYFGPDMDWASSYRAISGLSDPGRAYRIARNSIFPGNSIAWSDRVPNGTFPGDPMCGAIKNGTYRHAEGRRFVFGCRLDNSVITDEFMENLQTGTGNIRIDSLAANAIQSYRFAARLSADGSNIFVANNVISKPTKSFYFRQRFRRHSQVVAGSPWQTKTILFDYAKQAGIDVNKSLITRVANHCSYIDGPFVEENVVIKDNHVFNHGNKGFELAGKWMVIKGNVNDREFLLEGDDIYGLGESGQSPRYELTLDCGSEAGVNSDNMARAFDLAGWNVWIDRNFYSGTGSNPGNDGEGFLLQIQGGVINASFSLTNNRQGPKGKPGCLAPWDVPVYGMFHGWNVDRGVTGLNYPNTRRIEDAACIKNFKPDGTPCGQAGTDGTNIGDLTFTCPVSAALAPDSFTVTPDFARSCIKLNWKDVTDNEVAFRVDRRPTGASDWVTISYRPRNQSGGKVANLSIEDCPNQGPFDFNQQEWYDYLAVPGEFYEYRVVAVNCENDDVGTTNVSPTIQFPVSVNPKVATPSVQVFPNPTGNFLQISGMENLRADQIGIFTTEGKKMEGFTITPKGINVESLPSGLFLLKISDGNGGRTKRFMKH